MRKNESDLIRKKLKEAILKMTPYQQDLMLVAVEKMKEKKNRQIKPTLRQKAAQKGGFSLSV